MAHSSHANQIERDIVIRELAFPVMDEASIHGQHYGLTKRELFAAMAMQGLLSDTLKMGATHGDVAQESVLAADALIAALEEE